MVFEILHYFAAFLHEQLSYHFLDKGAPIGVAIFLYVKSSVKSCPLSWRKNIIFRSKSFLYPCRWELRRKFDWKNVLTKSSIFDTNYDFLTKISVFTNLSIFDKKFFLWQTFRFFTEIWIFHKHFDFSQKFDFSQTFRFFTKISIFHKNFDLSQKFRCHFLDKGLAILFYVKLSVKSCSLSWRKKRDFSTNILLLISV